MPNNTEILNHLFETGQIALRRGPLFDLAPGPMPASLDFDKVEGMLLALAIGDGLGNNSEGLLPPQRRARFGEIRDYPPNKYTGEHKGYPSDDSQLAFWTLEQMLADNGFNPEHVADRFCRERIFGIGGTVKEFLRNYRDGGKPWYESGPKSAGNGALMRIAPLLLPHLRSGTAELWTDTALAAMLTHNDASSTAACLAFVQMLWQVLSMPTPPKPEWWLAMYVQVARELELGESYTPRGGAFQDYHGSIWRFVEEKVGQAYRQQLPVVEACNQWYSGAYLLETLPSVIYILMQHGHDPAEAVIRAVNDTKDNDTIAAIVGAVVGALHGRVALPQPWLTNLSGRTGDQDDGRIFELIIQARQTWWQE